MAIFVPISPKTPIEEEDVLLYSLIGFLLIELPVPA